MECSVYTHTVKGMSTPLAVLYMECSVNGEFTLFAVYIEHSIACSQGMVVNNELVIQRWGSNDLLEVEYTSMECYSLANHLI